MMRKNRGLSIKLGCLLLVLLFLLTACRQPSPPPPAQLQQVTKAENIQQITAPTRIHLPVIPVSQLPELPNGCEATSLAMVLTYYGFTIDKQEAASTVLPREDCRLVGGVRHGPSPAERYIGDPATSKGGYYCFPPVVAQGAASYLAEQGLEARYQIRDISGLAQEELEQLVSQGVPLIVWAAKEYAPAPLYSNTGWYLPEGDFYRPFSNLHCMVLVGYTPTEFIFCDPLASENYTYVDKKTFMLSHLAMGSMALAIEELSI